MFISTGCWKFRVDASYRVGSIEKSGGDRSCPVLKSPAGWGHHLLCVHQYLCAYHISAHRCWERWEDGERADDDLGAVHSAEAGPMQRGQKLPYPSVRSRVAQCSSFNCCKKKLMGSGQIWFSEALRVQRHYILSRFELIKGFRKIIEIRMFLADFSPNVTQ